MSPNALLTVPAQEKEALVKDFQRLAARFVRAGEISQRSHVRLLRMLNDSRKATKRSRLALEDVLDRVLAAREDGTMPGGLRMHPSEPGTLAVYVKAVAPALARVLGRELTARELRSLLRFGAEHFPAVVLPRTERLIFGAPEQRYRAMLIDLEAARAFLKMPARPAPAR